VAKKRDPHRLVAKVNNTKTGTHKGDDYLHEAGKLTDEESHRKAAKEEWYRVWEARLACERRLDKYLEAQRHQFAPSPELDKSIEAATKEAFVLSVQANELEQLIWQGRQEHVAAMFEGEDD